MKTPESENKQLRRLDYVSGKARLEYPDEKVIVECEISIYVQLHDEGVASEPFMVGRVWRPGDEYFLQNHLGKECVLELKGRPVRFKMWIADNQGTIARHGEIEGFPTLKG